MDPVKHSHAVRSVDDAEIRYVVELSKQYSVCVIAGFVEHNPEGKPFITQLAAHDGRLLGTYRKKTIKEGEEEWFAPGDRQPVFSISGLKFGLSVCADIDDPDIFAEYAALGAAIVFESAAPGLYEDQATRNWASGYRWWRSKCIDQLGQYAAAQAICIATATQAGRTIDEDFPGGGYLFDPRGNLAAESGDWNEGVLHATVDV